LLLVAVLLARWPASRFAVDALLDRDPASDERARRPAGVGTE
jgi:hypothetical protein